MSARKALFDDGSSAPAGFSSNERRLVDAQCIRIEGRRHWEIASHRGASAANERRQKGKEAMTAELFRTVSTCVAALFVSTMLVTAATSMPLA